MSDWLEFANILLLILGGGVGYIIKGKIEENRRIKEGIYEKQRQLYIEILEPYIKLFTKMATGEKDIDVIVNEMQTYEYRKKAFELNLFGSDEVIKSMNKYWQHIYSHDNNLGEDKGSKQILLLFGDILIEVRKSLGNKHTQLKNIDMFKFFIKDIDKLK